jgi:hypothetical protein
MTEAEKFAFDLNVIEQLRKRLYADMRMRTTNVYLIEGFNGAVFTFRDGSQLMVKTEIISVKTGKDNA